LMIFMVMKLAIPTFAPSQCGGSTNFERERGGYIYLVKLLRVRRVNCFRFSIFLLVLHEVDRS
jgi:hypothetical protein